MTTVAQIAEKYNKGVEEVKSALETLGYGKGFKAFAPVNYEAEGKLDVYWKQKSAPLTESKAVARPKASPRERKLGKTQVMEKPRRVFSRPTPIASPVVAKSAARPIVKSLSPPVATPPPETSTLESLPLSSYAIDMEVLIKKQNIIQDSQEKEKPEALTESDAGKKPVKAAMPDSATAAVVAADTETKVSEKQPQKGLRDVIKIDDQVVQKRKKRRQQRASAASAQERILQNQHAFQRPVSQVVREVPIPPAISVYRLADRMALKNSVVIRKLMEHGITATANEALDKETAWIVVEELGHRPIPEQENDTEWEFLRKDDSAEELPRPPIVTVMGHVDHGKTSLLDYLRKTQVAAGEAGGITQHIGAYQVETPNGKATFIDTPGHALFSQMRARGANLTDIVVLVVAADEGVKPQTIESINHAQAAGAAIIVAVNKIDKPAVDMDRIKKELSENGLLPEDWGGDAMIVPLSAKTGEGIDKLLEAIGTLAEILEIKAPKNISSRGVVLEARVDKGCGVVVSLIVTCGVLSRGNIFLCGSESGRVRAMFDSAGNAINEAPPATPVEIQGLSGLPKVGAEIIVVNDERKARNISQMRQSTQRLSRLAVRTPSLAVALLEEETEKKEVNLIVKADVGGSREVLETSVAISGKNIGVKIIHSAVGGVTESDIHLAHASHATVIAFNVRPDAKARKLAEARGVKIIFGKVIYELVESVREILLAALPPVTEERVIGTAEVRKVYGISKVGNIAGCFVSEGDVLSESRARLLRDGAVVYEGAISSLRHFKESVKAVRVGEECGIGIRRFNDIKVGDVIEALEVIQKAAEI